MDKCVEVWECGLVGGQWSWSGGLRQWPMAGGYRRNGGARRSALMRFDSLQVTIYFHSFRKGHRTSSSTLPIIFPALEASKVRGERWLAGLCRCSRAARTDVGVMRAVVCLFC